VNPPDRPAWTPEREISIADARRVIREQFPSLAGADLSVLAQGWDNTAVRAALAGVENEWIFRFPRRALALAGIRREIAWLPRLAPLLALPIPVPTMPGMWHPDAADQQEAWPFWGGLLLPGTELAIAAPGRRRGLAAQLGAFLRGLHSLPVSGWTIDEDSGLELDPMGRGDPARRAARTSGCLGRLSGQLSGAGLRVPLEAARALTDRAARLPPPAMPPVICHGDLHLRHVLVRASGEHAQATGIIDWGDLCLADPAVDLSIAFGAFEGEDRHAFFAAYGPIDADRELRARALAVSLNALLTEYALGEHGSASPLLPEVSEGIGRSVAG
jgi:aminoglycoside phosphotransferase (APT) family kinase protein